MRVSVVMLQVRIDMCVSMFLVYLDVHTRCLDTHVG